MNLPGRNAWSRAAGLAAIVLLAACSASADAPGTGEPRVIEVTIDGFHFVPDHFTVSQGESVRFMVSNPDRIGHELFLGTVAEQAARRASNVAEPPDEEGVGNFGYGLYLPALTDGEFDYVFSSEEDLLIGCHLPGHWEAGMVATIDIEP